MYVHIPFCAVRCGYCDFNTYANLDFGRGASIGDFASTLAREIELSLPYIRHAYAGALPKLSTIFFGGGTPTMLAPEQLAHVLEALRSAFGFAPDIEITTEANPESVTEESIAALASAGFTRISCGMQSAVERILKILDRSHTPGQTRAVIGWAKDAGLATSVDLIYGTPGETSEEWQVSIDEALSLETDHISAYALTVEPNTKMGRMLRRGELSLPDADQQADFYEQADESFTKAGLTWYEVSNWAKLGHECKHNLAYWHEENWWGYGPGAHSHLATKRWWNLKHPRMYTDQLIAGELPIEDSELLSSRDQANETMMLGIRLREGIAIPAHTSPAVIAAFLADGLIEATPALRENRLVLTRRGRLLADSVIRELWISENL